MNKKILIVGGAGYIGSHTARELKKSGYKAIIFDSLENGHKEAVKDFPLIIGKLSDSEKLKKVFKRYSPDAVLHFANYIEVGESVKLPEKFYKNNVLDGKNLLMIMLENGCRKIVFSSSAAVYGEPKKIPITEDEPLKPINPYGDCKVKFEKLLEKFSKRGLQFISLRYFNAAGADPSGDIGEDHTPETHLIPLVLQVPLKKRASIKIFGTNYDTKDGTCIRDYIHVSDLAKAHILALKGFEGGIKNQFYNLGNGSGFSVREIIKTATEVCGKKIEFEETTRRAGDPAVLVASSEKIQKELGWKAEYKDMTTIIGHAWFWHKNHPNGYTKKLS